MSEFGPDPDFSYLHGPAADTLRAMGAWWDNTAREIDSHATILLGNISGRRAEAGIGKLVESRQDAERTAEASYHAAGCLDMARGHADAWTSAAPKDSEIDAADAVTERAYQRMMAAVDRDGAAGEMEAGAQWQEATQAAQQLRAARVAADQAYRAATTQLQAKVQDAPKPRLDHTGGSSDHLKPLRSDIPESDYKPLTTLNAAPGTDPAVNLSAAGGDPTAKAGAALPHGGAAAPAAAPAAGGAPMSAPMPTGAPAGAPTGRKEPKNKPLDLSDFAAPVPMAVAAPFAATAPATAPLTAGNSVGGLRTGTDVSGGRTAVNLSGATATNPTTTAPGTAPAGRGMGGMPAMPMMPMGMGGAGGGGGKERKLIQQSETNAELHGINAMAEAVRGGTLLRRDDNGESEPLR